MPEQMIEHTTRTDPIGTVRGHDDGTTAVKVSMGDHTGKGQHVWCWIDADRQVWWLHHHDVAEWAVQPATTTFDLLDAAAERGHDAMFEGQLPADGIERDLWHQVVLAVLDDPQLLPAWARAARADADTWHRAANDLDAELQRTRKEHDLAIAHDRQPYPTAHAYEQACRTIREKQARIDAALALHVEQQQNGGRGIPHPILLALTGEQPTDSDHEVPHA